MSFLQSSLRIPKKDPPNGGVSLNLFFAGVWVLKIGTGLRGSGYLGRVNITHDGFPWDWDIH